MDTKQRQSIDQNLRKLTETASSDILKQDYSGNIKDIKVYIYLNKEKTVHKILQQLTFLKDYSLFWGGTSKY